MTAFLTSRFHGSDGTADWPCHGEVILRLPAATVREFTPEGIVSDIGPGRCRLLLGSWSWTGLAAAIGRFDADFEVIGPPELAAACARLADRYTAAARAHSNSPSRNTLSGTGETEIPDASRDP